MTKQYIFRAVRYFIRLLLLLAAIYLLLFITGSARVSAGVFLDELFASARGWLMIGALALLAAFYPKFGFVKRRIEGVDITEDRDRIIAAFHAGRYMLADEKPGVMTFKSDSPVKRVWLMGDSRVTVAGGEGWVEIDGIRKAAVEAQFRLSSLIQNKGNRQNE